MALAGHSEAGPGKLHARGQAPTNCPQGTADPNDGCTSVPAGASIQFPNFLTAGDALQNGQTVFSTRPLATSATPSNQAFVDYPDGPGTPVGGVWKDPLDKAQWPAGLNGNCPLEDHTTYWVVDCTSSAVPLSYTWRDFDMRPNLGRVQANKGPVFLEWDNSSVAAPGAQSVTVTNNKFGLDDNCGFGQPAMIWQQHVTNISFTVDHNSVDGNFPNCRFAGIGFTALSTFGAQDIGHNYVDYIPGRPSGGEQGALTIRFHHNMLRGCETQPQQGHGECQIWEAAAGTPGGHRYIQYNTVVLPTDTFNGYTSTFYDTGSGQPLTDEDVDHNVVVVNRVGGWSSALAISGTLSGKLSDDAGGTGNIFEVTVFGGGAWPLFAGTLLTNGTLAANIMEHVAGSPATGVGSKWRLQCIYNGCGTAHKFMAAGKPYFGVDIPDLNQASASFTWDNGVTTAAGLEFGTVYSGQLKISTNFIDKTGDDFSRYFVMQSGTCGVPTAFSGNKDLLTGAAIDRWDNNFATGC